MNPLIQNIIVKEIVGNKIILEDGREFEFTEYEIRVQRVDHDQLPEDFCDVYLLKKDL